jgi:3-oxoacyl-[acyl-carrier protein] reductase
MLNVVVTGGSRGLGLGTARMLAASGYNVVAVARTKTEALTAAMDEVAERGLGGLVFIGHDLSDTASLKSLAKTIRDEVGPVYGLVNNAGLGTSGLLANMSEAQIGQLVTLNLLSPVILTKYLIRPMMSERRGRVINLSSVVAMTGYQGLSVYSATKASLIGFTRSLARELGPLGITVNAVAPGFVDTEMTHTLDDAARQTIIRRSALRRMPDIDDIAHAVDYLMSEKAKNITGTIMTIDAGNTA